MAQGSQQRLPHPGASTEKRRAAGSHGGIDVRAGRAVAATEVAGPHRPRPARQVVPALWIDMLFALGKMPGIRKSAITVRQFYRGLAQLGGFLARKHDGELGWITIWRGWEKLHTMLRGYQVGVKLEQKKYQNVRKDKA